MTGPRVFVIVCANGRDRDDARRLGLLVGGFDRVELVVLATADRVLRGLTIAGWALTEGARHALEAPERWHEEIRLHHELRARTRPEE